MNCCLNRFDSHSASIRARMSVNPPAKNQRPNAPVELDNSRHQQSAMLPEVWRCLLRDAEIAYGEALFSSRSPLQLCDLRKCKRCAPSIFLGCSPVIRQTLTALQQSTPISGKPVLGQCRVREVLSAPIVCRCKLAGSFGAMESGQWRSCCNSKASFRDWHHTATGEFLKELNYCGHKLIQAAAKL